MTSEEALIAELHADAIRIGKKQGIDPARPAGEG